MGPAGNYAKTQEYREMEKRIQESWKEQRLFEVDAPDDASGEKFFATFPYPYMNGKLHLGHSFSLSKVDFAVAYQRLLGKRAVLPFGFHCTGMPIKACADKLKREIEEFGYPPKFPVDGDRTEENLPENVGKAKKSKVQAKSEGFKYQWQIMRENIKLDLPKDMVEEDRLAKIDEEIRKFVDPEYWFAYFPAQAKTDLEAFGLGVDWRRTFITTNANPFYDSFVKWQFLRLKEKNKIRFGKRHTIYSPLDNQPCMDHDRSSGEGVLPVERTFLKVRVVGPSNLPVLANCSQVFVLIHPPQPETAIDSAFVPDNVEYIAVELLNQEALITTQTIARNICYQGFTPEDGKFSVVASFSSSELKSLKLDVSTATKFVFMEPESPVISRSGDQCVVALCNQWYLDYGDEGWKEQVRQAVARLETFNDDVKRTFYNTLDWLHEHACSRTYGAGTILPWDDEPKNPVPWLIESLSDSTIYMAYYTVAHLLQDGKLVGTDTTSPLGIKPSQMTPGIWDYIFLGKKEGLNNSTIPQEHLERLRREFLFWYPVDLRSSGKDLIMNHLTFFLYHHCAIWEDQPEAWPKSVRCNGHLMLNSQKMSKSTGNFLTLEEAINRFSADAVRFALADAGDGIEDANFVNNQADTGLLKLSNCIKWCEDMVRAFSCMLDGDIDRYADRVFANAMNKLIAITGRNFDQMLFKEALKSGFFEYQDLRLKYKEICGDGGMHRSLIRRFIETQALMICPICPHLAETMWSILGNKESIFRSRWPEYEPVEGGLHESFEYLMDAVYKFRMSLKKSQSGTKSKQSSYYADIYVSKKFSVVQSSVNQILKEFYNESGCMPDNKIISAKLSEQAVVKKKHMGFAVGYAEIRKKLFEKGGMDSLEQELPYDELEVLTKNADYIKRTLGLKDISIRSVDDTTDESLKENCCIGNPQIVVSSVPSA
ncbi:Leucine--tRNA ligase, cytoplasmic, partial [Fragariocoptes setiger]